MTPAEIQLIKDFIARCKNGPTPSPIANAIEKLLDEYEENEKILNEHEARRKNEN